MRLPRRRRTAAGEGGGQESQSHGPVAAAQLQLLLPPPQLLLPTCAKLMTNGSEPKVVHRLTRSKESAPPAPCWWCTMRLSSERTPAAGMGGGQIRDRVGPAEAQPFKGPGPAAAINGAPLQHDVMQQAGHCKEGRLTGGVICIGQGPRLALHKQGAGAVQGGQGGPPPPPSRLLRQQLVPVARPRHPHRPDLHTHTHTHTLSHQTMNHVAGGCWAHSAARTGCGCRGAHQPRQHLPPPVCTCFCSGRRQGATRSKVTLLPRLSPQVGVMLSASNAKPCPATAGAD